MDNVISMHELAKLVTIADTISWIKSGWYELKPQTIRKCFIHCGFFVRADGGSSVDIAKVIDSGSDLTKLCEFANGEVDLSSMHKHTECFKEDENCDLIVTSYESMMKKAK